MTKCVVGIYRPNMPFLASVETGVVNTGSVPLFIIVNFAHHHDFLLKVPLQLAAVLYNTFFSHKNIVWANLAQNVVI